MFGFLFCLSYYFYSNLPLLSFDACFLSIVGFILPFLVGGIMGFAIAMAIAFYISFYDEIQAYRWSKKSDAEKYAAYRQYVNDWNGTDYD